MNLTPEGVPAAARSLADELDRLEQIVRALEAYIMAQRKGVAMEYGKH